MIDYDFAPAPLKRKGALRNTEEEQKRMRSGKILSKWQNNLNNELDEFLREANEIIIKKCPLYDTIKQFSLEINKFVDDNVATEEESKKLKYNPAFECLLTKKDRELQSKCSQYIIIKKEMLSKTVEELEALLSACDTYEQEIEILKARNIINDSFIILGVTNLDKQDIKNHLNILIGK